jgi:large subunit ribosomal protein L25
MSAVKQLKAASRDRVGKGAARAVRRQGQIPAVIYGGGAAPEPVALDEKEMRQLIFAGHFLTTIFEIDVNGQTTRAIPRDYQLDPVRDVPLHVDFLRLAEGQAIRVEIPIHVIGQSASPGVKRGGLVQIVEHSLEIMVPADSIPDSIDVSVAELNIGDAVHLADIALPEGARAVSQENLTLVTLVAPTVMAETAAAAEGEATPAAGPST